MYMMHKASRTSDTLNSSRGEPYAELEKRLMQEKRDPDASSGSSSSSKWKGARQESSRSLMR